MLRIEADRLQVETRTLTAVVERGILTSLTRRRDGLPLVRRSASAHAPLELVFAREEAVPLGLEPGDSVALLPINDHRAEIRVHSWHGDGVIALAEDVDTGDLIVEPSGYSSRPGLRACRWSVGGLEPTLEVVAPFFQGVRLPFADPLIRDSRWPWPHFWEAQLVILQGRNGGLCANSRDDRYRYKALRVGTAEDPARLGFDTESYGPMEHALGAGGVAWRLNVYDGDWRVPAAAYRDWLERACRPEPRADWLPELRFAVSWCPCEPGILEALRKRLDPRTVLLHIPDWRTQGYDRGYPAFTASAAGRAFVETARAMGFRAMPHFNSIDMDPTHPSYAFLRDFQYREIESGRVQGWTWADGMVRPVPESNAARLEHQAENAMVKIHPGLGMWRSILAENVRRAAEELGLELAFLDVTLCTWNLRNALVENLTSTEGMRRLISEVAAGGRGLAVGGEGRNETTAMDQSLAQVHLFKSWQTSTPGLERAGGTPLNEYLFGERCRSFGYTALGGSTEDEAMRMRTHVSLGAIPTVTVRSAREIERPTPAVEEMLRLARR